MVGSMGVMIRIMWQKIQDSGVEGIMVFMLVLVLLVGNIVFIWF